MPIAFSQGAKSIIFNCHPVTMWTISYISTLSMCYCGQMLPCVLDVFMGQPISHRMCLGSYYYFSHSVSIMFPSSRITVGSVHFIVHAKSCYPSPMNSLMWLFAVVILMYAYTSETITWFLAWHFPLTLRNNGSFFILKSWFLSWKA